MKFKLFSKLGSLAGTELVLFLIAIAVFAALLIGVLDYRSRVRKGLVKPAKLTTRALVYGAMCMTLSFVLSYFKLFSMPFGGSITLLSMLPLMLFACAFGPKMGFIAAFAYALLQIVQGAWIVHPVQFVLDYFAAFLCLGIPAFFPKNLPLGVAVGGFARMLVSIVSGAVFFADGGLDYGIANPWVYSFLYNFLTIGVDTVLCLIVAFIPKVKKLTGLMR
ncbi:MAG: energy-coupled thiamine transporter ThiT [Clostridia bacterium]|nr:energy-coupled thiamine transporter ThiT [Clostridia bacterium]